MRFCTFNFFTRTLGTVVPSVFIYLLSCKQPLSVVHLGWNFDKIWYENGSLSAKNTRGSTPWLITRPALNWCGKINLPRSVKFLSFCRIWNMPIWNFRPFFSGLMYDFWSFPAGRTQVQTARTQAKCARLPKNSGKQQTNQRNIVSSCFSSWWGIRRGSGKTQ